VAFGLCQKQEILPIARDHDQIVAYSVAKGFQVGSRKGKNILEGMDDVTFEP